MTTPSTTPRATTATSNTPWSSTPPAATAASKATIPAGIATTGQQLSTQILATTSSGKFSFLDLDDNQSSWGGTLVLPIATDRLFVSVSGGWWGLKKDRDYRKYNINLNSVGVLSNVLFGLFLSGKWFF